MTLHPLHRPPHPNELPETRQVAHCRAQTAGAARHAFAVQGDIARIFSAHGLPSSSLTSAAKLLPIARSIAHPSRSVLADTYLNGPP